MNANKIKDLFRLNIKDHRLIYLPTNGIYSSKVNLYNEFIHNQAKILFEILNKSKIEYYVFAGSAIGLIRDKKNIPWVDDYDIIIFEENMAYFNENVVPNILENGFKYDPSPKGIPKIFSESHENLGRNNYFQCDIFVSKVINGFVKNIHGTGRYHSKNIPVSFVKPARWFTFHDDLYLPFFNKPSEDIKKEYGDVFRNAIVHIDHGKSVITFFGDYKIYYQKFNEIKKNSIKNTHKMINNKKPLTGNYVNEYFMNTINLLKDIKHSESNECEIRDINTLYYAVAIKFYLPEVKIKVYLNETSKKIFCYLNYADDVMCENEDIYNFYTNTNIVWNTKPNIMLNNSTN